LVDSVKKNSFLGLTSWCFPM